MLIHREGQVGFGQMALGRRDVGIKEGGRGKKEERRGKREEGRGTREEGRGKRKQDMIHTRCLVYMRRNDKTKEALPVFNPSTHSINASYS